MSDHTQAQQHQRVVAYPNSGNDDLDIKTELVHVAAIALGWLEALA